MPAAGGRRSSNGLWVVAAGAAVLAVVAGSLGGYRLIAGPSCGNPLNLTVAAAPDVAPAVRATAQQWVDTKPRIDGNCVRVQVAPADPADVAAAVAGQHQRTLSGVGQANGRTKVPDAWIPDSGTWVQRLRALDPTLMPADAPSVARSPVVLAMPEPLAATLGWPNKKLTWNDLLPKLTADTKLRTGIVEPNRDAAGASGLLAMAAAANASPSGGQQATVAALRALATGRSALRDDLLARFPRAPDPATLSTSLGAAPLSEQAVIQYNSGQPPVRLAAVYVNPPPLPLDYPFAVLPGLPNDKTAAARALAVTLSGNGYRDRLAQLGLRAANGSTGAGFPATKGADLKPSPAPAQPDPATLDRVLATWTTVISPGRLLAVIDVSGSMLEPVPTAGNATREQVTVESARRGVGLFDDTWAVGLWTFSTNLDGANDYKELVPIGLLANQRQQILNGLSTIQPKKDGNTGLYDTMLAAYKNVQQGWDPSRVNSVIIMTDGKNEDQQGLSLDQLIDELKKAMDPTRPVVVIAIGLGNGVSESELQRITNTTGGGTFVAPDPSKMSDIFLKAISLRPTTLR
jgi:Ca-activated chloride channel family protein